MFRSRCKRSAEKYTSLRGARIFALKDFFLLSFRGLPATMSTTAAQAAAGAVTAAVAAVPRLRETPPVVALWPLPSPAYDAIRQRDRAIHPVSLTPQSLYSVGLYTYHK